MCGPVCIEEQSELELPTPLHFAAKYGLSELTACLLDLPDAIHASLIANCHGHIPEDLARASQRHSLATVLENFREVVSSPSRRRLSVCLSICLSHACFSLKNEKVKLSVELANEKFRWTTTVIGALSACSLCRWISKNITF